MYVLDTSAWIGYLEESKYESFVDSLIKNKECFTPTIVLSELADNFQRRKHTSTYDWKLISNFVCSQTELIPINKEIAETAARIKVEKRKKFKDVSLADCIVIATSQWTGSKVLSTDKHITSEDNAVDPNEFS